MQSMPQRPSPQRLSQSYIEELARIFDARVETERLNGQWHVRVDGKLPKIETLMDRFDDWITVIERFLAELVRYYSEQTT